MVFDEVTLDLGSAASIGRLRSRILRVVATSDDEIATVRPSRADS